MNTYLCSLGSNIEPQRYFPQAQAALQLLSSNLTFSRNIATTPVDMVTDNQFLNALFLIQTPLTELELKQEFNRIEEALGRDRSDPKRSLKDRTIDIDILGQPHAEPQVPEYLASLLTDLGLTT